MASENQSKKMYFKHHQSIPAMFLNTVTSNPEKIALKFFKGDEIQEYNFAKYKEKVFLLAAGLIKLGLKAQEHAAILAHTSHHWCITDLSILSTGASSVTIFRTLGYEQVKFEVDDSDSVFLFVDGLNNLQKVLKIWKDLPELRKVIIIDMVDEETGIDLTKKENLKNLEEYRQSDKKEDIYHLHEILGLGKLFLNDNPDIISEKIEQIHEDDLATIIYTSGTTGVPKGVMLSHKNFISDAMMGYIAVGIRHNEVTTTYLPLAHSFAHTVEYIGAILKGNCLCFAKNYDSLVDNLHDFQPTAMIGVPYVFEQIYKRVWENVEGLSNFKEFLFRKGISFGKRLCNQVQEGKRPNFFQQFIHNLYTKVVFKSLREKLGGRLRIFVSGGAALNPEIGKFFWAAGVEILEGYGLSEAAPITHVNRPEDTTDIYPSNKIGSIGPTIGWDKWGSEIPYKPVEARISEEGELLIYGPNVMSGYYKRPEETEDSFAEIDGKHWLRTGDLATIDEDGYAKIIGRAKHIIVLRTGKKIAPKHVEPVYKQNKYIEQVLLLGEGEKFIAALIVPNFELKEEIAEMLQIPELVDLDNGTFTEHPKVHQFFHEKIKEAQEGRLSHFETIKEFRIVPNAWTEENNLMTPSLKLKRSKIMDQYQEKIDEIFSNNRHSIQ